MPDIDIDIKRVRNANYAVPAMISALSRSERTVNLLKWRIPAEVQERRNIKARLELVSRELKRAQELLNDIYTVTEGGIDSFTVVEHELENKANLFE